MIFQKIQSFSYKISQILILQSRFNVRIGKIVNDPIILNLRDVNPVQLGQFMYSSQTIPFYQSQLTNLLCTASWLLGRFSFYSFSLVSTFGKQQNSIVHYLISYAGDIKMLLDSFQLQDQHPKERRWSRKAQVSPVIRLKSPNC